MALPVLETPMYELELPSSGEKIKFRPFLVREHKILMTLSGADTDEVVKTINELINVCTFEKLDVERLSNFDIEYIFLNLRAKSIGEVVKVVVNCPCGNDIDQTIDLNKIRVEKQANISNKIMLRDNVGVIMRYPNFNEMMAILDNLNSVNVFFVVSKCIDSIFTEKEYFERGQFSESEGDEFLSQLTKDEFKKIEEFFLSMPKVVQDVEADCSVCGRHNQVRMEGIENFFV